MSLKKLFLPFVLAAVGFGFFYSAAEPLTNNGEVIAGSSTYGLILGGFAIGILIFSLKLGKK